ncbi:asparaginase [Mesonia maritima]|uniref:L-asparaginase n=1 Tax=Mesonia maritima TaxID=1793873 RepID=A0ABU1K3A6_9FLAO|nr:asparaginase [Mesonia maritima]MDR6300097.1 L-asparaginase [Mesonia maritima]
MRNHSKILLIYTGGTIGMIKDFETGALRPFNFDELLHSIPELKLLDHEIETVSFEEPMDSSNMNPEYYKEIATIIEENYEIYDGFVVLHGSDTMSYSASALSFMFENLSKPIIYTGSQLPIGDLRTDAKENLITSIQLAGLKKNGKNVIAEVGLYFEYKLYRANRTTKINAEHFQAFNSLNYPALAESGVHLEVNEPMLKKANRRKKLIVHKELDNNIMILKLFPGINENIIHQLISTKGLKGIIMETYGSGNACDEDWFINLLQEAMENGIFIVNVTQCIGGSVVMGHYATSTRLEKIGVISGKDITTESAVAKMMYLLPKELSPKVFKTIFETSLRGEML